MKTLFSYTAFFLCLGVSLSPYVFFLVWLVAAVETNRAQEESSEFAFPASPVVGILAQPHRSYNASTRAMSSPDDAQSQYVAASYVKWLEAGGARSIPIPYDATDHDLLDEIFYQIQALFLPGGDAELPYAVTYLLNKAQTSNKNGQYFPVWGTCLGFEFLVRHVSPGAMQSGFDAENMSLPLLQVKPARLYRDPLVYYTVTQENVTLNNHILGIEPRRFQQDPQLSAVWQITSVNRDAAGRPFVSTMEPLDPDNFPFYGVQYHPEKNAFEYATWPHTNIPYEDINHSPAAVDFSMHVARFVVDLARLTATTPVNFNATTPTHAYTLPDRFPMIFTYPQQVGYKFEQIYLVPNAAHFAKNNHTKATAAQ